MFNMDRMKRERLAPLKNLLKNALEFAAPIAALLCLIDCIVLPILAAISPFLGMHEIVHGVNDQVATLLVVVLVSLAFFPNFIKHRNPKVAGLAALGIFFVFFANSVESTDKIIHFLLAISGSACIIKANSMNKKLAASASPAPCPCDHHHH